MLGYKVEGKTIKGDNTTSSVRSLSVTSINQGSTKPVHDLLQEELERKSVKILCSNQTKNRRLPPNMVS